MQPTNTKPNPPFIHLIPNNNGAFLSPRQSSAEPQGTSTYAATSAPTTVATAAPA